MRAYYVEKAGEATFNAASGVPFPFMARRVWLRHIGGTGVAEVSLEGDFTTTHVKLEELSSGLEQTHPVQVEIEGPISKVAVKGSGLTVAIRATS